MISRPSRDEVVTAHVGLPSQCGGKVDLQEVLIRSDMERYCLGQKYNKGHAGCRDTVD